MRERDVEARLTRGVRQRLGGLSVKIAPIMAGIPDRLIILPGARLHFIEVKAVGGRLRPVQVLMHERLRELGVEVIVLTGPDEVDQWLDQQKGMDLL